MIQKIDIQVDEQDRNALQRADIEASSMQGVIATIISQNLSIGTDRFHEYELKYQNAYRLFDELKNNLQRKYIFDNSDIEQERVRDWNLDYRTGILTLSVDY